MKRQSESDRILGRRVFMKALGVGIAAPLAMKMSGMAMAGPSPAPVRLFIFYVPHGQPVEHFEPLGSGAGFLEGSGILAPLAPFKSQVNVVRGLSMNGASNHAAIRATLTGAGEGEGVNSIDYTIAQGLGLDAHVLGAIPYERSQGFSSDSFLVKHGSWVRPTESPIEAAAELLGSAGPANPAEPDESVFRNEALTLTERQLERMHGALSGLTKEQSKLSVHLDAMRALKASGSRPVVNGCDTQPTLPAVEALRGADVLSHENFGRVLDAHLEVAANALFCGTSRIVTLQNLWVNSGLSFGFSGGPGIAKGHHDPISHSWDAAGRAEFARVQRWFYERLVEKLITVLDQPDPLDPANTVLHNTLIYVCSEVSDGANHNSDASEVWLNGRAHASYLPAVLIGRAGGYLGQKEVVTVSRRNTDMLATLAKAMGVNVSTVGGQSVNPIQEIAA
jgi:Protein of unknown function (DUF1552)